MWDKVMQTLVACLIQLVAYAIKTPGYVYKLYSAFLVIMVFCRLCWWNGTTSHLQSLNTAHPEWIWLVNKVCILGVNSTFWHFEHLCQYT